MKNGVKNIQTAGYNNARTVIVVSLTHQLKGKKRPASFQLLESKICQRNRCQQISSFRNSNNKSSWLRQILTDQGDKFAKYCLVAGVVKMKFRSQTSNYNLITGVSELHAWIIFQWPIGRNGLWWWEANPLMKKCNDWSRLYLAGWYQLIWPRADIFLVIWIIPLRDAFVSKTI